jgi:hypothetical protein
MPQRADAARSNPRSGSRQMSAVSTGGESQGIALTLGINATFSVLAQAVSVLVKGASYAEQSTNNRWSDYLLIIALLRRFNWYAANAEYAGDAHRLLYGGHVTGPGYNLCNGVGSDG